MEILQQTLAAAKETGRPVSVAVVDDGGHLLAFSRSDHAESYTIQIALAKARTAAMTRHPSGKKSPTGNERSTHHALAITLAMDVSGLNHIAMITDGRFSGGSAGPCIGHISPEAAAGGPIAAVRNGDMITIDIPGRSLSVDLTDEEIQKRLAEYNIPKKEIKSSYMRRYIKLVSSAAKGAVLED